MRAPFLGGDHDPGGSQDGAVDPVALLVDLGDRARLGALDGLRGHRLVLGGVERLALGRVGLDADAPERAHHLVLDLADALGELPAAVLLGRAQGEVEVIERGEQLLGELGHAAVGREGRLARGALAVVLEVGLRALGEREVFRRLVDGGRRLGRSAGVGRRLGLSRRRGRSVRVARGLGGSGVGRALLRQGLLRRGRGGGLVRPGDLRGGLLLDGGRLGRRLRVARLVRHRGWSSTTSASTTSSSAWSVAAPSALAPSPPLGDAAACCAWARSYIASETLWNAVWRRSVRAWMSAASSEVSDSRTSLMAASISLLEASSMFSSRSLTWRSAWYAAFSAALRASASSRRRLSSSACDSASDTMRLISSSDRPEPALISIFCSLPVPRSFAVTLTMPLASMSKPTSICGMPRGAGGMPVSWNLPSDLL